MRGRGCGAACLLALSLSATRARAAEIHYDAPASCDVTREAIETDVERLVGRPLDEIPASEFYLEVRRVKQRWQLVLRTKEPAASADSGSSARRISGATCREVADVAVVAMALAIEGRAPPEEQRGPWESLASEDADSDPDPVAVTSPSTAPATPVALDSDGATATTAAPDDNPIRLRFGLAASVLLDGGALPSWAPGGAFGVFAELGALRVELAGALFLPQRGNLSDGRGGEFDLALGTLHACGQSSFGDLNVLGCGGFEAGMLSGHGLEVRRSRAEETAWFALSAGAGLRWAITASVGLQLRAELTVPMSRPDFVIDRTQSVHRAAAIGFRAGLGAQFYL